MRVCSRLLHPEVHFEADAPSVVPGRRRVSGRSIHEASKRPKISEGCEEARAHRQLEKQRESAKNAKPLKAVRG